MAVWGPLVAQGCFNLGGAVDVMNFRCALAHGGEISLLAAFPPSLTIITFGVFGIAPYHFLRRWLASRSA